MGATVSSLERIRDGGPSHYHADAACGRGVRPADCLRQRRQPAAGARRGAAEGVCHPARAGAPGSRIARQLLTENMLLALAGGAAGSAAGGLEHPAAVLCFQLGTLYLPLRPVDSIPMDGRVFAFALLVSCLTGVLFGVVPALSALRTGVNEPLKEGGARITAGGGNRLRHVLVASEVALALVVLSGAGLMIKSMTRLLGVDPGLESEERAHHGDVGSPGRDLRRASGAAALLPGSRRTRGRHSRAWCRSAPWLICPFKGTRAGVSRSRAGRRRTPGTCRARTTPSLARTTSGPWAFRF